MKVALALSIMGALAACSEGRSPHGVDDQRSAPEASVPATFVLVRVNDQSLPVPSPYGAGEWDYGPAGNKELTAATLRLTPQGAFTHEVVHGSTKQTWSGTYSRTGTRLTLVEEGTASWATLVSTQLVWRMSDKLVLTFEAQR